MSTKVQSHKAVALHDQIRRDLVAHYPTLHLFTEPGPEVEVRGTFPVLGEGGRVLDSFQVKIVLPPGYPRELPITRETGGRIPWTAERHIDSDGTACVLLPDERWRVFPIEAPFLEYLRGPLHSFFLSQVAFAIDGQWPFGEWGHGADGIVQHYSELLRTSDIFVIGRFLQALMRERLNLTAICPCGSGKRTAGCCRDKLMEIREKIDRSVAERSFVFVALEVINAKKREMLFFATGPAAMLVRCAGSTSAGIPSKGASSTGKP